MIGEEFAFSVISSLFANALQSSAFQSVKFVQRLKIKNRVEIATAEVAQLLQVFLSQENITEHQQRLLMQTCVEELRPLAETPEQLFKGSLNGQQIFDNLYKDRPFPEVVVDEGLKEVYALLCPRIATLLCKIPAAVTEWEGEAWRENFRRFDEIVEELRSLFAKVDALAIESSQQADKTLRNARRIVAQKIGIELDLTGLRADRPVAGKFANFFVHPQLVYQEIEQGKNEIIETENDSFDRFIGWKNRAVLIGGPGAGKSTWSKWLQRETVLSDRWEGIGVRVELRGLTGDSLPSLNDLIRKIVGDVLKDEITSDRLHQWLEKKQVIFILDGFDEIAPSSRDTVRNWILELQIAAQNCPIVLTSRSLTTEHLGSLGDEWLSWSVEPFDESRIVDYIQRWYQHTPLLVDGDREIDAHKLAQEWRNDPTIEPLTGNPLLLSTLLMVHHLDGRLPSGRSKLYERYVEGMLGLWDDRRKVTATSIQLSPEQKRKILQGLALSMHLQETDQLDEEEILSLIAKLLDEMKIELPIREVVDTLRERSGLIVGPGIYSFVHKSVAEYLVAETIVQGDRRDESGRRIDRWTLFENRDSDRWNTIIFLWAGLASVADVEEFLDKCNEHKSHELAYGLLYDQYDNIPSIIRIKFLRDLLDKEYDFYVAIDSSFYISTSSLTSELWEVPKMRDLDLPITNLTIRKLGGQTAELYDLLSYAVTNNDINWSDVTNTTKKVMRDIMWTLCIHNIQDVDNWEKCLRSQPPENGRNSIWIAWSIQSIIDNYLINSEHPKYKVFLSILSEYFPDHSKFIPIWLIATSRSLFAHFFKQNQVPSKYYINTLDKKVIEQSLQILTSTKEFFIDSELLQNIKHYHILFGREVVDLLKDFIRKIDELYDRKILEDESLYKQTKQFIQKLIERREREKVRE
ncbi:MAG: NACHT domain-containing protein [Cyanobacteria bacterium SBLK]|nr:NACHT domain-containing protein [Cyanobacteria bacterium SBLK]